MNWIDQAVRRDREAKSREILVAQELNAVWLDLKAAIDESVSYFRLVGGSDPTRITDGQPYVRTVSVTGASGFRQGTIEIVPRANKIGAVYECNLSSPIEQPPRTLTIGTVEGKVCLLKGEDCIDVMRAAEYLLWPVLFPELPEAVGQA